MVENGEKVAKREKRAKEELVSIKVKRAIAEELYRAQGAMQVFFGRRVSMSEVLERLLALAPKSDVIFSRNEGEAETEREGSRGRPPQQRGR